MTRHESGPLPFSQGREGRQPRGPADRAPRDAVLRVTSTGDLRLGPARVTKLSNLFRMQRGTMKVLETCCDAVRRGGTVTVVGVYGTDHNHFPLGKIFDKGLRMWFGQAPVHNYLDGLLAMVVDGRVRTDDIVTHTLPLEDAGHAYRIFNRKEDDCVKVVLKP